MINIGGLEKDRRRFDIGSGISLELLDSITLQFVFHDQVRDRILGKFSDIERVIWDSDHGVATRQGSQEVMFLGASPTDKVSIRSILKEYGNVDSLLQLQGGVTYEFATRIINEMVRNIGRYIYLATALGYNSKRRFISDHSAKDGHTATKRLVTQMTKDTGQSRILALSYDTGQLNNTQPDSHPEMIRKSDVDKISSTKYTGVLASAKRALDILGQ